MKQNKKELAILRGKWKPETLEDWAKAFGEKDKKLAEKYALAISSFLGSGSQGSDYLGQLSPNTRAAYAYAVAEFFEWVAARYKAVVPPHKVVRRDAEDYVNWLANRPFSLAEEKLKDGDFPELERIFEIIREKTRTDVDGIIAELSEEDRQKYFPKDLVDSNPEFAEIDGIRKFSLTVRRLVTMDIVTSSPTWEELRKKYPQAGITQDVLDGVLVQRYFTYRVKKYTPVSRTTVALRVSALSSFWKALMRGENVHGGDAIIQYDIWDGVKERVSRGIAPMKREAAQRQKMPKEAVIAMLQRAPKERLKDKRDRAMLFLLVFAGLRTTELLSLRRGNTGDKKNPYFESSPPTLVVKRKGNKWMRIPYPTVALSELVEFQAALDKAEVDERLRSPDAPLFPSLYFWGNNRKEDDPYRSMSRVQLFRLLRQLAERIGLPADVVEKVHPHAFRHFAANSMLGGGKDLREIQALLGHASVTTTESYLEAIENEEHLSGQEAILTYLQKQDVPLSTVTTTHPKTSSPKSPTPPRDVIDSFAVEVKERQTGPLISESLPSNDLPIVPEYTPPEEQVVDTLDGPVISTDQGKTLIAVGEEASEDELEKIIDVVQKGKSPGAPDHVYTALSESKNPETVIFNRGGQSEVSWLLKHYPKIPKDYGVGKQSYLPWFVKAKGLVSKSGFYRGLPPFPVFSSDQVAPSTRQGKQFLDALDQLYVKFTQGSSTEAPSPIRGVGLVKWFGFFAYMNQKLLEEMPATSGKPLFMPWDSLIDIEEGPQFRTHKDEWLLEWLETNSHTFRASVDAMKRGVPKGEARGAEKEAIEKSGMDRDIEKFFAKASFEGIDLIEKMPSWMTENDPVNALFREDPKEYAEFIKWLRNVTGQALSPEREQEISGAKAGLLAEVDSIRGILELFYQSIDEISQKKVQGSAIRSDAAISEDRADLRSMLYAYLLKAARLEKTEYSAQKLLDTKKTDTREFNRVMRELFDKYHVPNPSDSRYKEVGSIQDRIARIIQDLHPDQEILVDASIFADSALFDPRWFRIDPKNKTIFIEPEAEAQLRRDFGITQNPTLLLRRAARAMYEAKDKGYDKLWGVMMSYLAWIVPTGVEMEADAKGIPVQEVGSDFEDRLSRKRWLESYVTEMKDIARGDTLRKALREEGAAPGESKALDELEIAASKIRSKDMQDRALRGVEFATLVSVDVGETPEDILMAAEEEFVANRRKTGFTKNGRDVFLHIEGERPHFWYRSNLFGDRRLKKNPSTETFVSPGIILDVQKQIEPARALLPSPFRMLAAMSQKG